MSSEAQRIILREVERIWGRKKRTATNVEICCPFHDDSTPSCGIYVVPNGKVPLGWFYCLGCGTKGPWNKLADKLGLEKIDAGQFKVDHASYDPMVEERLKKRLLDNKVEMPYGILFNDNSWRGINGDLLRELGAVLSFKKADHFATVWFPVKVRGNLVATIKAQYEKREKQVSYINDGRVRDRGLFPYDYVDKMLSTGKYNYLIVTEGPRDALNSIQNDMPALAMLGTNNWAPAKCRLLVSLCIKHDVLPLVIMDSGKVGRKAQKKVSADLKESLPDTEVIKLHKYVDRYDMEEELDLGNCPKPLLRRIRRLVRA